jgi:hypothetical protein
MQVLKEQPGQQWPNPGFFRVKQIKAANRAEMRSQAQV